MSDSPQIAVPEHLAPQVEEVWQHLRAHIRASLEEMEVYRREYLLHLTDSVASRPPNSPWPRTWVHTYRVKSRHCTVVLFTHFNPTSTPNGPILLMSSFSALQKVWETNRGKRT